MSGKTRPWRLLAALGLSTVALFVGFVADWPAGLAFGAGAAVVWSSQVALVRGLSVLLTKESQGTAAGGLKRRWLITFVFRLGLAGVALFVLIVTLALPPVWLLLGLSAWPVTLCVELALRPKPNSLGSRC